jgi:hypothetical protein
MQTKRRAIPFSELSWSEIAHNDPNLLRDKLKAQLGKPVSIDQLSSEITRILKTLGTMPGSYETVAHHIATGLAPGFSHVSKALERLIANRPAELAAALEASEFDEYRKFAGTVLNSPKPKKTRTREPTEEEKRRNRRASKNRYERRKRQHFGFCEAGLIEQEFAIRKGTFLLSDPLNRQAPTGPCLDVLLNLGYVPMSGAAYCLESLLGMDRHNFPKSLPHVRRSRRIFYDICALVKCVMALVAKGKWLPDGDRRKLVLSGIIQRARDVGQPPALATVLEQTFRPYLT